MKTTKQIFQTYNRFILNDIMRGEQTIYGCFTNPNDDIFNTELR